MGEENEIQLNPRQRIMGEYSALFRSEMGRDILADMFENCNFLEPFNPEDKMAISRYNTVIAILQEAGMLGTKRQLVNAFASIFLNTKEVER